MHSGAKGVGVAYEGRSAITAVCRPLGYFPFKPTFSPCWIDLHNAK